MEGLAPPLKCLIEIQSSLQNSDSFRTGLNKYLQASRPSDDFAPQVRRFLYFWEQGMDVKRVIESVSSPQRRAVLEISAMGLAGQPVLSHLEELKSEISTACDLEIKNHMEILPIKMLAPLLLMQFPSFLLLMFGPLLKRLVEELNR